MTDPTPVPQPPRAPLGPLVASVALALVCVVLVLAAVTALAGGWWAVLVAGCGAGYGAYVTSTRAAAAELNRGA